MWKLWNLLFGWDYIIWQNTADRGVARVLVLPEGKIGYWRYKNTRLFDIISNKDQVFWLTCIPEKYAEKFEGK